jgi:hypothetical protein
LFVVVAFNLSAWLSLGKGLRLVHKRPQGEVAAAGAPQGNSSGAGAKPDQPVCEQVVAFTTKAVNTGFGWFFGRFLFFLPKGDLLFQRAICYPHAAKSLRACIMTYSGR